MEPFFTGDSYDTSNERPRKILDKLLLNTRLYFVARYSSILFRNRKVAVKGLYDREAWARSSYEVFKLIEDCGGKFHISGLDNLSKRNGPVVFICNHMSTLETMIFPGIIAPLMEVTFVVKQSLIKHPVFGPVMRARKPIVVSRSNIREDLSAVMEQGTLMLLNDTSIIIFPQTTRKLEFIREEFNSLGVKLAARAGAQVIPIAIKTDFWGNGKIIKDLGKIDRKKPIHIKFGPPISVAGTGKMENQQVVEFIISNLKLWDQ
jgi:1-acyl-sn-glycerol-3-phosphate acyltransferase